MTINELIRFERKKKQFTLVKLAEKTGISYGKLVRMELGKITKPGLDELKKISSALNVCYESLIVAAGYDTNTIKQQTAEASVLVNFFQSTDYINTIKTKAKPAISYQKDLFIKKHKGVIGLSFNSDDQLFSFVQEIVVDTVKPKTEGINFLLYKPSFEQLFATELKEYSNEWCCYFQNKEYDLKSDDVVVGAVIRAFLV